MMTNTTTKNPKLTNMLELLQEDADTDRLVAELRDTFLDIEAISHENSYDITGEVASCPKHVLLYAAQYIEMLKQQKSEKC